MATTKEVRVVINGEEHVSEAANQASAGIEVFGRKLPFVVDAAKLLEMGLNALSSAVQAAKAFVVDSLRAYDEYALSQSKLTAVSKLTGIELRTLKEMVQNARSEFGLSTVAATDITGAVARFAGQSGQAARASELMAAALDLGSAAGMDATQIAEGLSSALAGNDDWLNKLGLANPSQIWKDYAKENGIAGQVTDKTTQNLAVMNAIIEAGAKVQGTLNERLSSGAGQQQLMNNKLEDAKVAFGAAIQPLRILIVQGLTKFIEIAAPVVVWTGKIANFIGEVFVGAFAAAQSAVGSMAEAVGWLTRNKSLEEWGRKQSQALPEFIDKLKALERSLDDSGTSATNHGKAHELAAVKITASADATKRAGETAKEAADKYFNAASAKLGKPLADLIDITTVSVGRLSDAGKNQLDPMNAELFAKAMADIRMKAIEGNTAVFDLGQNFKEAAPQAKSVALDMVGLARGALDAAQAFGVVDSVAASALTSVINMGQALARVAGGDLTALPQLLGGVANVISTLLGGDSARRELLRQNTAAIDKLSRDIGGLKLNVTGEDFAKAKTALSGLTFTGTNASFPADFAKLLDALDRQGLRLSDLKKIAEEMGIGLQDKNGNFSLAAVQQLMQALNTVSPGRLGSNFQDQLAFFKESQRIEGSAGTLGGLQGMLDFLKNVGGVTALGGIDLSNPGTARGALRNLFTSLNNGTGVEGLGKLTGSQLMDVIVSLIDGIDALSKGTGIPTNVDTGSVSTGGGASVPSKTVQDVIDAMNTSVTTILTEHTTYHTRIAEATEQSALYLQSIDAKMTDLIDATTDSAKAVNVRLESLRQVAAANAGRGPSF